MFGEKGLGFLVSDTGMDDDIVALAPIGGCRYPVLVTQLECYPKCHLDSYWYRKAGQLTIDDPIE